MVTKRIHVTYQTAIRLGKQGENAVVEVIVPQSAERMAGK